MNIEQQLQCLKTNKQIKQPKLLHLPVTSTGEFHPFVFPSTEN